MNPKDLWVEAGSLDPPDESVERVDTDEWRRQRKISVLGMLSARIEELLDGRVSYSDNEIFVCLTEAEALDLLCRLEVSAGSRR